MPYAGVWRFLATSAFPALLVVLFLLVICIASSASFPWETSHQVREYCITVPREHTFVIFVVRTLRPEGIGTPYLCFPRMAPFRSAIRPGSLALKEFFQNLSPPFPRMWSMALVSFSCLFGLVASLRKPERLDEWPLFLPSFLTLHRVLFALCSLYSIGDGRFGCFSPLSYFLSLYRTLNDFSLSFRVVPVSFCVRRSFLFSKPFERFIFDPPLGPGVFPVPPSSFPEASSPY